ncbi:SAM-dependent methyltransferase [Sphingomonas sanguinis]|uniref:SAM-dependent methyltransferase n=1 Tax=Sphingomonas sp. LC-1 TaxID=3110957 RepID=UPI0021BAB8B9|nr:SAM-dependent methyltransferase [Sphingomonas sp. LC-1]MCT8001556.1 SAM-dependent methyltransferase [Sphingomonas sp. LC-1]
MTDQVSPIGDPRWSRIVDALSHLRAHRRHAVRIIDADCAGGALLIAATRQARSLGFTAIEGLGIDPSPQAIGRARAAARRLGDPAIGLDFQRAEGVQALAKEADFPADILLCHATSIPAALAAAGDLVIGDQANANGGKHFR